jgi:2-dehydro-3-deoxygluconokinase
MARPRPARGAVFDVLVVGETHWSVARTAEAGRAIQVRPGGGAVNTALALAQRKTHVGLVTIVENDALGLRLIDKLRATGIDTSGVTLRVAGDVLLVRGERDAPLSSAKESKDELAVPEGWMGSVVLLSTMSPALAITASCCRIARESRRRGALEVLDMNVRWDLWAGRDWRSWAMVLREADVVRCSFKDLGLLGTDVTEIRGCLRKNATLVVTHGAAPTQVFTAFGEFSRTCDVLEPKTPSGAGDRFTAGLCAELAKAPGSFHTWFRATDGDWDRTMGRAQAWALGHR